MPVPVPDPPTNVQTHASKTPGRVELTWDAPQTGGVSAYEIIAHPTLTVRTAQPPGEGKTPGCTIDGLEASATYSFEVRSVGADGAKSDSATSGEIVISAKQPSAAWWLTAYFVALLFLLAGAATFKFVHDHSVGHCLGYACGVVALALVLLSAIGGKRGFWRAIIGADRRISTSYSTTGLWTILVAFVLAYLSARAWFYDEKGLFKGFNPGTSTHSTAVWDDYLVLLGGPFAALVFARGIVSAKVQNQTVQKTVADDGTASIKQALTDDSGNVDLVDSQYFLFNLVAFGYVIAGFASTGQLPAVPAILLALTGSSAATYVVNKAVQNTSPTVTGVTPSSFRPGERCVITGTNFMPVPNRVPVVTIGGKQALVHAPATGSRVTAIVPPNAPAGTQDLVVTTAARASTDARPVQVLADNPQIAGIDPPVPTTGREMRIRGAGFTSALDTITQCSVLIGTIPPITETPKRLSSGLEEITLTAPADVPVTEPVDVVVRTPRLTESPAVPVRFRNP